MVALCFYFWISRKYSFVVHVSYGSWTTARERSRPLHSIVRAAASVAYAVNDGGYRDDGDGRGLDVSESTEEWNPCAATGVSTDRHRRAGG